MHKKTATALAPYTYPLWITIPACMTLVPLGYFVYQLLVYQGKSPIIKPSVQHHIQLK